MARSGPITLSFPPFEGATRRLIVVTLGVFFASALLGLVAPAAVSGVLPWLYLSPGGLLHGAVWELVTYEFLPQGILGTLFSMLTLWFFGSSLEERFGGRWLVEFYLLTAALGGLAACLLAATGMFRLGLAVPAGGAWAPILALLMAFAVVAGDQPITFNFFFTMKVKYLVGLYVLYYAAILLLGPDRFGALVCLCCAGAGYGYMRLAPRRGFVAGTGFSLSERFYAMRNEFYRQRRRNAAKKFQVYMKKQDREVHFDKDGRYVDPDAQRDPSDKRWMN